MHDCRLTDKTEAEKSKDITQAAYTHWAAVEDQAFAAKAEAGDLVVIWPLSKALRRARKSL